MLAQWLPDGPLFERLLVPILTQDKAPGRPPSGAQPKAAAVASAAAAKSGSAGCDAPYQPGPPLAIVEAWLRDASFTLPWDQNPGTAERFTELWAKAFKEARAFAQCCACACTPCLQHYEGEIEYARRTSLLEYARVVHSALGAMFSISIRAKTGQRAHGLSRTRERTLWSSYFLKPTPAVRPLALARGGSCPHSFHYAEEGCAAIRHRRWLRTWKRSSPSSRRQLLPRGLPPRTPPRATALLLLASVRLLRRACI